VEEKEEVKDIFLHLLGDYLLKVTKQEEAKNNLINLL
jgi:hypothetical protein